MILQSLYDYYQRLAADPNSEVARPGFTMEKIGFALVLNANGELVGNKITDLRDSKKKPRMMLMPEGVKRSRNTAANFLWDNSSYILQVDDKENPDRTKEHHQAFQDLHEAMLSELDDVGAKALPSFLRNWAPDQFEALPFHDVIIKGGFICFQLLHDGQLEFLHKRPVLQSQWLKHVSAEENVSTGQCLITGKDNVAIARLHTQIRGVIGANTTGASIAGINFTAGESQGQSQYFNAPVSEDAVFAYTTAINRLLAPNSRQKITIADTTVVIWAKKKDRCEPALIDILFGPPSEEEAESEDDALYARNILDVLVKARQGHNVSIALSKLAEYPGQPIFILGLAPNAARLSVRFWETESLEKLVGRVGQHYADIEIVGKRDIITPLSLLRQTAVQGKQSNIPFRLVGDLLQAILTGSKYPLSLYSVLLVRIRAERIVNQSRAAMIKGILVRNFPNPNKEILTMSLNTKTTDVAYRLGRLFAVLEGLQYSAVRPSATIKDRYFGAASSTPASVFPNLLRNAQNHISKIGWGDQPVQEILTSINEFPPHLDMQQQGRFIIGYYHQRQDHFEKIAAHKENNNEEA